MATILDLGLIQKFDIIFPFLFVLIVVWGMLSYAKFLGTSKSLHAFIAIIVALLILISDPARNIINSMAPWFVLLFIFILFVLMSVKIFGVSDSEILNTLKSENYNWIIWVVVLVGCAILVYSVFDVQVWQKTAANETTPFSGGSVGEDTQSAFFATIRNPQVLGLVIIFLIGAFAIQRLAKYP